MKEIKTTEELRAIQIEVLDHFDRYCKEHLLTYYLCAGTLLGAIRHHGYIPWDDDIDVMMPRGDYEKLLNEYALKDNSQYKLFNYRFQEDYPYPFSKLGDSKTSLIEAFEENFDTGIYIDIFPIDNIPDDTGLQKKIIERRISLKKKHQYKLFKIKKRPGIIGLVKNAIVIFLKIRYHRPSLSEICRRMDRNAISANTYCPSSHKAALTWNYTYKEIMPNEIYKETVEVEFEGKKYPAPAGWDTYLKGLFGDYMKLPPEDQRRRHQFKAYIID